MNDLIGKLVRVRGQAVRMTVVRIKAAYEDREELADCVWFDGGSQLRTAQFPSSVLVDAKEPKGDG